MNTPKSIYLRLKESLPFTPTIGQDGFIYKLSDFLMCEKDERIFLLKGYAGTGKTSMVTGMVDTLKMLKRKYALLAPTGRAAKVLASYSGQHAFTIHKFIYQIITDDNGKIRFSLRHNRGKRAVIIVDEASMIPFAQKSNMPGRDLLTDLMKFLSEGENCQLILIGDTAQLPPIGSANSPALDPKLLHRNFNMDTDMQHELKDVVRQEADSGILKNATALRNELLKSGLNISLTTDHPDVMRVDITELEDELNMAYSHYGEDGVMMITRSNKNANQFNQQIRMRIKYLEDELSAGDRLMVVHNNYFWLPKKSGAGFIANGDLVEVLRSGNVEEIHGFRFVDCSLRMLDYPDEATIDAKLLLNTLHSDGPSLADDDRQKLYESVSLGHAHLEVPSERALHIARDPYLNALQVKFGYAVTCHKAQGGQWPAVFVDQGYLTAEMLGTDHLRWLYTAMTRATEKLYLVNFSEQFLSNE